MDRDIALKQPAEVIDSQIVHRASEIRIGGATLGEVGRKATYLYRAGRIEPDYVLHKAKDGTWFANVILKPERTWWQKNRVKMVAIPAGGLALLAGLYFLLTMLMTALVAIAPYVVGGIIVISILALLGGRKVIEITQSVTIK